MARLTKKSTITQFGSMVEDARGSVTGNTGRAYQESHSNLQVVWSNNWLDPETGATNIYPIEHFFRGRGGLLRLVGPEKTALQQAEDAMKGFFKPLTGDDEDDDDNERPYTPDVADPVSTPPEGIVTGNIGQLIVVIPSLAEFQGMDIEAFDNWIDHFFDDLKIIRREARSRPPVVSDGIRAWEIAAYTAGFRQAWLDATSDVRDLLSPIASNQIKRYIEDAAAEAADNWSDPDD